MLGSFVGVSNMHSISGFLALRGRSQLSRNSLLCPQTAVHARPREERSAWQCGSSSHACYGFWVELPVAFGLLLPSIAPPSSADCLAPSRLGSGRRKREGFFSGAGGRPIVVFGPQPFTYGTVHEWMVLCRTKPRPLQARHTATMRCSGATRERGDGVVRAAPFPLHAWQRASHTWMGVCLFSPCCSCRRRGQAAAQGYVQPGTCSNAPHAPQAPTSGVSVDPSGGSLGKLKYREVGM